MPLHNLMINRPTLLFPLNLTGFMAAVALLATGCATPKPVYPAADAGTATSVLKIDNTMADSMFALQWNAAIGLRMTVDGFSPLDKSKLTSGGQISSKQFVPKGITEVRLPAGSHTLVHEGKVLGRSIYYFKPVTNSFETEEGKTYTIRFKNTTTPMNLRYAVEYEGWNTEQTSQWPSEVRYANPILGR